MKKTLIILAMITSALLVGACSASAPKLTDAGNEAFTQEAYDEALQAYQEAQVKSPELAEPYYNAANTLYRQGNYEEALKQLQKALQVGEPDALAQNVHFNAGNAAFNGEDWQAAVDDYTAALLRNPDDQDAKVNLELALQKLQEQQQQSQTATRISRAQDQQNQDQQNQDQQDQQDQQNQDQQNQDQQNQQDQQDQQDQQNRISRTRIASHRINRIRRRDGQQRPAAERSTAGRPDGEQAQDEQQPREDMQLAPGQRMTEDQARQLLAAVARNSDTLQQRLGQIPAGAMAARRCRIGKLTRGREHHRCH